MFINPFYTILTVSWFVTATVTFVSLFYVSAPYGRHSRQGWGPGIQARFGWLIMESASPLFLCLFLFRSGGLPGGAASNPVVLLFAGLWLLHYANRAFIYPFRMRGGTRPMALTVVLMAFSFNVVNGYLNGTWLRRHAVAYGPGWLSDPRLLAGAVLFISGFLINIHSDGILRRLRNKDGGGYKIPRGGLFTLVTGANYFGEILEWFGWACLTWSTAGLAFAFWAACNLVPRAKTHHRWYIENFPDYPKDRKTIIPFLF